ncbi:glycosyltransferase family 2 protein [Winogradskyella sp. UBA3174]|uniref:glycosyltransferase family 2 protein n=1 Tax=Winogradskyella sp. UBA3174 TaxID=1947785 RepID=UPI0025D0D6A2|nr:glycosyltransferase [Winogradskyella sp. UBA3174]|tara:strand:- start:12993 stop:14021 length:1029 start_codon:yes stop_codon:yes gene_type:complete
MRLSIVIPVYNAAIFLSLCLESLLNQDIDSKDYEILVIDDGSSDNSLSIANSFSDRYDHINVHSKLNGGVGSARNKGLALAKGAYIYFIDPDDYLAKDVLNTILKKAEDNKLDVLTFRSLPTKDSSLFHSNPNKIGLQLSPILNGEDYIANNNYQNEVWWYIIKRTFFLESKITFIEERWMEDAILTAKLFLKANAIANFPMSIHRHVIVEGSAMTSKEPSHYIRVINDNYNAALVFDTIINKLKSNPSSNKECLVRLNARQQSFVFFMMVRMLKSTIHLKDVKPILNHLYTIKAYPLNAFLDKDYNGFSYTILVKLFNSKTIYYSLFRIFNPLFRLIHFKK